ncbi:hypothetical protein SARC_01411 [Sphaeroforma arctica JP610]|uniref:Uncharacterized protein n=1 Tax=Sphaeroforma arctica JP610 TaxID=667725 RepID=A0A0L0GBT2_9EUKA|nr:hypothetical protein SARC_01411 [Sphaeroforma arctica JP610]KNC86455.1 hypothetical protein SARC_01411 [Sphaeroforma arctica JP610]|eukprot:XP_014160357.1 hypothetical protein SARC_01411 [Sphaeroforma arctica JP610]
MAYQRVSVRTRGGKGEDLHGELSSPNSPVHDQPSTPTSFYPDNMADEILPLNSTENMHSLASTFPSHPTKVSMTSLSDSLPDAQEFTYTTNMDVMDLQVDEPLLPYTVPSTPNANSSVDDRTGPTESPLIDSDYSVPVNDIRNLFRCNTCKIVTPDVGLWSSCATNVCRACSKTLVLTNNQCTNCSDQDCHIVYESPLAAKLIALLDRTCSQCNATTNPIVELNHVCVYDCASLHCIPGEYEIEVATKGECTIDDSDMPRSDVLVGAAVRLSGHVYTIIAHATDQEYVILEQLDSKVRFKMHVHSALHLYYNTRVVSKTPNPKKDSRRKKRPSKSVVMAPGADAHQQQPTRTHSSDSSGPDNKRLAKPRTRFRTIPLLKQTKLHRAVTGCRLSEEAINAIHEPTPGYVWRVEAPEQRGDTIRYRAIMMSIDDNKPLPHHRSLNIVGFGPSSYIPGSKYKKSVSTRDL